MNLSELRTQIDGIDKQLIRLLEDRMDISAGIAAWKRENNMPVLDLSREQVKIESVRAQCRPETADLIAELFEAIMAASRVYQAGLMEDADGK